uniref:Secreted protein n=1 Tax=Coccidioides posadasii RMSCC 3488 TaxID=454284 RepID=A0A0J6F0V0_COCPO|nr:hypothetical protein CPAG_02845 [Coccidioides posadasii RMSCC 3488]
MARCPFWVLLLFDKPLSTETSGSAFNQSTGLPCQTSPATPRVSWLVDIDFQCISLESSDSASSRHNPPPTRNGEIGLKHTL